MLQIPLSRGRVALIDDEDYLLVQGHRWFAHATRPGGTLYAIANNKNGNPKTICMHRLILGTPKGTQVDHINMDGLDNRKTNLRFCTPSENQMNKGRYCNNKSGFKGVNLDKRRGLWRAAIRKNNKVRHIGYFRRPEEAANAYRQAALVEHGKFART